MTTSTILSNASYGKRQEFMAVAELIRRGFDVYLTLVDDKGIDCIIRKSDQRYLDIQIKARSAKIEAKNYGYFPLLNVPSNRDNHFFVFYSEKANEYWVLPSEEIIRLAEVDGSCAHIALSGKDIGKYAIRLTGVSKGEAVPKKQFAAYQGDEGFKLLK
ncbi:hypothetical protein [Polluticoccus soli]|uniref:hypothetical protein n=1 Tax=Polluticoccus soli TaxID=3034150 RepID=UPI0023E2F5B5|nr:hypothetical protein [Flavipsychrobacter sp. JY13-12]